jgi:hypothetical protein
MQVLASASGIDMLIQMTRLVVISLLLFSTAMAEQCPGPEGYVRHEDAPLYEEAKEGAGVVARLGFKQKLCVAGKQDRFVLVPKRLFTEPLLKEPANESEFFGIQQEDIEVPDWQPRRSPLGLLREWFFKMGSGMPSEDALSPLWFILDYFKR